LRQYINGVQDGTVGVTGVTANDSSTQLAIGRAGEFTTVLYFGYLSDYRFVSGTCLYPSGTLFTPPTAPLTAIANTQLLTNFTNAGIIDGTMENVLETVGNAQVSTSVVKYGSGSIAFDGTGDNLQFPSSQNFAFNQGEFTIEFWFFCNAASSTAALFDLRNPDTSNIGFDIFTASSKVNWGTSATVYTSSTTTLVNGVWYHLAAVRGGTTMRLYINGILEGTPFTVTSSQNFTNSSLRIGFGANGYFNGYIDDLRITKGVARYISNFTPPQVALPRQ
jgi:hypothetical protein